jgi:hypothetical protein
MCLQDHLADCLDSRCLVKPSPLKKSPKLLYRKFHTDSYVCNSVSIWLIQIKIMTVISSSTNYSCYKKNY